MFYHHQSFILFFILSPFKTSRWVEFVLFSLCIAYTIGPHVKYLFLLFRVMEINSTVDQNKCWGLFPSWGPGVLSQPPHHTDCPYLETFIRRTVPCPPPTNPCLFWAAANNSKLSSEDIQLVTSACDIPSFSECSHYPPLNPSIFVEGICTPGCLGGVVSFLILSLLAVSLVVVFSLKRRER